MFKAKMYVVKDVFSQKYLRRHYRNGWFGPIGDARLYKNAEAASEMIDSHKEGWKMKEGAAIAPVPVAVNVTLEELA